MAGELWTPAGVEGHKKAENDEENEHGKRISLKD
jgi:hypothetical protein